MDKPSKPVARQNVACEIRNLRHTSSMRVPVSADFKAEAVSCSVNFDFVIQLFLLSVRIREVAGLSDSKWSSC